MGLVHEKREEWDQALDHYRRAHEINRRIGFPLGEAVTVSNMGLVYVELGDGANARRHLSEALGILDEHGLAYGRDRYAQALAELDPCSA